QARAAQDPRARRARPGVVSSRSAAAAGRGLGALSAPTSRRAPGTAVLVDDLVVRFDELVAVAGVSFAVTPGEVFGLLGPNGAGKTTTIRVLTTLLPATAGRALVAGHDVAADALAVRASIGYIPQAISVDGALTARENLDFYARVTGVPGSARRERIEQAIAAMDLHALVEQGDPRELLERNGSGSLEEVFTAVTGRELEQAQEGRLADVRARRRVARRLG